MNLKIKIDEWINNFLVVFLIDLLTHIYFSITFLKKPFISSI